MKKFCTVTILFFVTIVTHAQPTITSSVLAVKGDTILMALDSTLVPAGMNGVNVIWDFTTSLHQDLPVQRIYVDPVATAYASKFPNAKLCRTDGIGAVYSYWDNSNSSKSVYYGFVEPGIYDQNYNNIPLSYYKFPITYGQNFTDTLSAVTNPGAVVGPGKYYFAADAWGTLKLPKKTVTNVLRTKSVIYIGDSSPTINSYSITTEYAWYAAGQKEPLLVISSVIINHVMHRKFIIYDNNLSTGLSDLKLSEQFFISPNPCHDKLNLQMRDVHSIIDYEIYDIQGRSLLIGLLNKNQNEIAIDLGDFKNGIYLLKISSGDKIAMKKFVVE